MQNTPSYYANIPASVRYDATLSPNAKLLYGEITALCNKEGFCWASNKYFADLYGVSPTTVSEWVRLLVKSEHVSMEVTNKNTRRIYLKEVMEKAEGGIRKSRRGVSGKAEHNNTSNTTSSNTMSISEAGASQGEKTKHNPLGGDVIKAFEEVDPKNKTYYGNTTQRKACDFLLNEYGLEEVLKRVQVLPKTNKITYFPHITTPVQLRDKWVDLQDAVDKKRSQHITKQPEMI